MLAKIIPHSNILTPLQYNETKLAEGTAQSIHAENFLKNHDRLSMKDKLDRFHQRSSLNEKVVNNGVHIFLNFGKTERVENEKMKEVSIHYMDAMGFKDQPYVVYRHNDAGHTHLHIITTTIRADGSNLLIRPKHLVESNEICKKLEQEFSLQPNIKARPEDRAQFEVLRAQRS